MLPEKIMQSDLLDILFENRNKTYGAYALRKSYNKILITAIGCTLFAAACFCVLQFLHRTKKIEVTTINIPVPDVTLSKPPENLPKPLPQHNQAAHVRQVISSTPKIVPDNAQVKLPPTNTELENAVIGPVDLNGKDDAGIIEPPVESLKSSGSVITATPEKITEEKPVKFAEVMPEFPGGTKALIKFILKNIRQPDDLQQGEIIKVMASFVVAKNGEIQNVKIINSGRADLDKEVLRVINKMPLWKPGMQNGKAVSVYFNLPVTFQTAME